MLCEGELVISQQARSSRHASKPLLTHSLERLTEA